MTISTTLVNYASSLLQKQLAILEDLPPKPDETERLKLLIQLGFNSCKDVQNFKSKEEQYFKILRSNVESELKTATYNQHLKEALATLIMARNHFGPDTLLLNFKDFQKVMDKYNLVCGLFSDYTGTIPDGILQEIANLPEPPSYVETLCKFEIVNFREGYSTIIPTELIRFPFTIPGGVYQRIDCLGQNICKEVSDRRYWIDSTLIANSKTTQLFICAPKREMKTISKVVQISYQKDPFICAYTKCGILILKRWGEEASADVIKKYEELNRQIDIRARELNVQISD